MKPILHASAIAASIWVSACKPSFAPANAPTLACKSISKAQFDAAKGSGATIGRGKVDAAGIHSLDIGQGASHCTKVPQGQRTCIRPNDFAIEYKLNNDQRAYVLVPKQTQYRFRVSAKPTPCRVIVATK